MAMCSRPVLPDFSAVNSSSSASISGRMRSASFSIRMPAADSVIGFDRRTNSSIPA